MGRIVKAILILLVLGLVGLTAYAYLGDYRPDTQRVTQPVVLDAP